MKYLVKMQEEKFQCNKITVKNVHQELTKLQKSVRLDAKKLKGVKLPELHKQRAKSVIERESNPGPGAYTLKSPTIVGGKIREKPRSFSSRDKRPGPCDYGTDVPNRRVVPLIGQGSIRFDESIKEQQKTVELEPKRSSQEYKNQHVSKSLKKTKPEKVVQKIHIQVPGPAEYAIQRNTQRIVGGVIGQRLQQNAHERSPELVDVRKASLYLQKSTFPVETGINNSEISNEKEDIMRLRQRIKRVQNAAIQAQKNLPSGAILSTKHLVEINPNAPYRIFQSRKNHLEFHFVVCGGSKFDGLLHGKITLKHSYPRNNPQIEFVFPPQTKILRLNKVLLECWWPCAGFEVILDEIVERIETVAPAAAKFEIVEAAQLYKCEECGASHETLYPILPPLRQAWQERQNRELKEQLLGEHNKK